MLQAGCLRTAPSLAVKIGTQASAGVTNKEHTQRRTGGSIQVQVYDGQWPVGRPNSAQPYPAVPAVTPICNTALKRLPWERILL